MRLLVRLFSSVSSKSGPRTTLLRSSTTRQLGASSIVTGSNTIVHWDGTVVRVTSDSNKEWMERHKRRSFCQTAAGVACPEDDQDVMAPVTNDYFELFGLPLSFDIDQRQLKNTYRQLMIELHPDKHTNKSANERDDLQQQAATVTRAYNVLKQAYTRATYLLEVLGTQQLLDLEVLEESSKGSDIVGMEFLMEVMEIRELIDESLDDESKLRRLREENTKHSEELCKELSNAFATEDYKTALRLTAQLQYLNRIDETIRENTDSLHG